VIRRGEAAAAAALVLAGVGLRLLVVSLYPTEPLSDFRGLVLFGVRLRDEGLAVPGWHWVQFSPGLPLILSGLFRLFPHGVTAVARTATAVATGLLPLAPFLLWRPILSLRARVFAGALLALWPGQVLFSGVPAQENWAMLPAVALGCVAARRLRLRDGPAWPVTAGLLFAAGAAIRQELLVVMVPPALAAAGLPGPSSRRARRLASFVAAALVPLLALAAERRAATGRFAVLTEHGGLGLLGTVVPGSASAGWVDPTLYAAALDPAYARDPARLRRDAGGLAAAEMRRRWRFHAYRASVAALGLSVDSERQNLYWSLQAPGVLPATRAAAGAALARTAAPWLQFELAVVSGAFAAAVVLAVRRRDAAILVLAAAVLLKIGVQVLFAPLGRLMVPAIALELLAVALGAALLGAGSTKRERSAAVGVAVAVAGFLLLTVPPLQALAVAKDEPPPVLSRFPLGIAGGKGFADCRVEAGRLIALLGDRATLAPVLPGGDARARCGLTVPPGASLGLDVEGQAAKSPAVVVDGREWTARHPLPGGWFRVESPGGAGSAAEAVISAASPFGFGFVAEVPGAPDLPRHRDLP